MMKIRISMENKVLLVIGGSLSGIQSAFKQAEAGNKVYLLESSPGLDGGKITSEGSFDPEHPFTGSDLQKLKDNPNIEIITNADIERIKEKDGKYRVKIKKRAIRVIEEKCNDCKDCIRVCPINMWDDYNQCLSFRTAIDYFNPDLFSYSIVKETPICQRTCPVNLDIRGYVGLIADGKYEEALSLIRERLPFPGIIGRICPHPCEKQCNRGKRDKSLCIRDLKRFVADYELNGGKPQVNKKNLKSRSERVAIIGAGPSGLTCAHDLAREGYQVVIYEALPRAGGMLAVGIPDYRLPQTILEHELDVVRSLNVEIHYDSSLGKDFSLDDLFTLGYKAVFIAVGAHQGMGMNIPGEDAQGAVSGVTLLRDLNLGKKIEVGRRVGVIGGGNVAIDAARCSLRCGAQEVTIFYRRSRAEMPASDEEIQAALDEGVTIEYLTAPQEVMVKDNSASGLRLIRMELGEPDASGRRRPIPIEGSQFEVELDMIIPAIGQRSDLSFISDGDDIRTTRWGTVVVDPDTLLTGKPGVFAGGDCVDGPGIAIQAIAAGKQAAESINNYLKTL
jgi:NADPH-dependent glutamate synthase beta subunit-like oxidoreductase/NAD-dependent dihydropyrimidine dehydrogenase PreA subunit